MADHTANYDWRTTNQTLQERYTHMFYDKLYCDVSFNVGQGTDRKISANKLILSAGSRVFHSMFVGSMGTLSVVECPEIEYGIFYELIRFVYTDDATITSDTSVPLLLLAKKYSVAGLEKRCIDFLAESLCPGKAFAFLSLAQQASSDELSHLCLQTIDDKTLEAVSAEEFCNIDFEVLCSVLRRDTLRIREVDLFEAVLRWAKAECSRTNLLSTIENQRAVLKEAIRLIRFPLMSPEEFATKVACLGILPNSDTVALFVHFNGITDSSFESFDFNSTPRQRQPSNVAPLERTNSRTDVNKSANAESSNCDGKGEFVVKRFTKTMNKWTYLGGPDEIGFSVDQDVKLTAVGLYGTKNPNASYRSTVELKHLKSRKSLCEPVTIRTAGGSEEYKVEFEQPVNLSAFTEYLIQADISGPPSSNGIEGSKRVIVDQPNGQFLSVTFTEISHKGFVRTSVQTGQIPALYFKS